MEKLTIFFVLFIAAFLFYSFLKSRKNIIKENKKIKIEEKKDIHDIEKYVIAAVVASLMDGKIYKIRNIFLEKKEKKTSAWKIAGIQKNMQRIDI